MKKIKKDNYINYLEYEYGMSNEKLSNYIYIEKKDLKYLLEDSESINNKEINKINKKNINNFLIMYFGKINNKFNYNYDKDYIYINIIKWGKNNYK